MKAAALLALVLLAGCASKPPGPGRATAGPPPGVCLPLPAPAGNGLTAQAAYAHTLVPLYAACAAALKAKP